MKLCSNKRVWYITNNCSTCLCVEHTDIKLNWGNKRAIYSFFSLSILALIFIFSVHLSRNLFDDLLTVWWPKDFDEALSRILLLSSSTFYDISLSFITSQGFFFCANKKECEMPHSEDLLLHPHKIKGKKIWNWVRKAEEDPFPAISLSLAHFLKDQMVKERLRRK